MNALLNAHTNRDAQLSPDVGFVAGVPPEELGAQKGVSSDCVQREGYEWYVVRVTYNRIKAACEKALSLGIVTYVPTHYVMKLVAGKKKRVCEPLLPNIVFIYATRELAVSLVHGSAERPSFVKFYLNRTLPVERNGKYPPMTIPYEIMMNFIRLTGTESVHVRAVSEGQCRYKSGDMVRVTVGEFRGIIGRVARIAGQQRVVVEMKGLCLVATAYIPSDFIEKV